MTRDELRIILRKEGFPDDTFSLEGGSPTEAYCLDHFGNDWTVYYSERGHRNAEVSFRDETTATEYFLALMRRDVGPYLHHRSS